MRVLMSSWAWPSHYLPLVPLGWALRAAGHEVRVASQPALGPAISDSGAVAVAVGPDLDHEALRRERMGALRLTEVPQAPPPRGSMRDWEPAERAKVRQVFSIFTAYAEAMAEDLLAYARSWRPDLIVHDPTTYAAPLVARALGIPAARHVHGVDVTYQADGVVRELIEPLARKLGLAEADVLGDVTVDPCPPSMQTPTGLRHLPVRYVPYNGRAVLPSWLWQPPERPRICITWGTSTTKLTGLRTFLPPKIIEAARRFGWELVVSLAPNDVAALGPVPEEVRVVESLALHLLLPSCTAVSHQGGNGTILTAAHYGVPQVTLPQLPDQTFHCDRFAQTGAGLVLRPGKATEDAVSAALETVVHDPSYARAAGRLRDEMLAQPTPAEIVPDLEALASGQPKEDVRSDRD